jgi:cellulose biosynthesis protein BcsQ
MEECRMKINIVVADEDVLYLKQLVNYLVKSTSTFEVYSFSQKNSLMDFLQSGDVKPDILLLSEDLFSEEFSALTCVETKILLVESVGRQIDGWEVVQKYQKMADLVSLVTLMWNEHSGNTEYLTHDSGATNFIGVYSPVGGSGKTTIAMLLAHLLALQKKKIFYMNYERVNSTKDILRAEAQVNMSELLVGVHGKDSSLGLQLVSKMYTAPNLAFSYVNPADSALEFNEISLDEQLMLLAEIGQVNHFDAVVLDFDSELNSDKLCLLHNCNQIVVPFLPDLLSINKMKQLFYELNLHTEYVGLLDKMVFVGNKLGAGAENYLRRTGLFDLFSPAAMLPVSGEMANIVAAMQNGSANTVSCSGLLERMAI